MRNYVRKSDRANTPVDIIERAVDMVLKEGRKITSVGKQFNIPRRSLRRYVDNQKSATLSTMETENIAEEGRPNPSSLKPNYGYSRSRQVFTDEQEAILVQYLHRAADIYYGLSPVDVRKLAFQFATKVGLKMPSTWIEKSLAGPDWFSSFIKRNNTLSIRKPEATSLARTSSFNKHNCDLFFDNYERLLTRENISLDCVWNMDETGVTTVMTPEKIVGRRGQKQIGAIVSAERGTLVTVVCAISAFGNTIPPFFVFPRVNFKAHFLNGGPMGCAGTANKSGWMNDSSMELFMKHFIKFVRPCKERPVMLLLDNHSSHLSIDALNLAKENYVHLLSFPAHCSHRLQPLDLSVYGPMKKFNSSAASAWMINNPGKTMSIYDIPGIVCKSYPLAANPSNITAGFTQAGIVPFDREGFHSRANYDPGFVTDRMDPTATLVEIEMPPIEDPFFVTVDISPDISPEEIEHLAVEHGAQENSLNSDGEPGGSQQSLQSATPISSPTSSCLSTSSMGTLEELRPFPKAGPRTAPKNNGRRKRTSAVLTDTPVKSIIEAEKAAVITKAARKVFPPEKSSKSGKNQVPKKAKGGKRTKKEVNGKDSFCPECGICYLNTKEDSIRCTTKNCGLWACESCVDERGEEENSYVCSKCCKKM